MVCFQKKNPAREISETVTRRAAKPSSRHGASLEVLTLGYAVLLKAAGPGRHVSKAHGAREMGAEEYPGAARTAVCNTHRTGNMRNLWRERTASGSAVM